jgi:hypothetical protein
MLSGDIRTMCKKFRIGWLTVILVAAAFLTFGCSDKNTVDTNADTSSTDISVAASPTSVETSETSVVEATVTVGGAAVSGQAVYFTVSPTTAGTVTPLYDTTGTDGVAATVFTATTSGAVVVQALIVGTEVSSTVGLSVSQGSTTGSGNVNLTVSRSLMLANGHDTSAVTIVVRDELGQEAPDGTLIKLVAGEKFVDLDGNGYWSQGIDSLVYDANSNDAWDSYGMIPSTVTISGGGGEAVVDYISGDEAQTVYIKATVDDGGLTGYGEVSVQLSPNAAMHSIYLASDSVTLSVAATGGIETATLRATAYDTHGNPVPEGMVVVFAILDGPGGGESVDTLAYGPDTSYTNGQGVATTTISSGTISGTVRVRAYSGTVLSNASQVLIASGPPEYIVIGASACNVDLWDNVADSVSIVAVVSDVYLNPVNDSTVVYFRCDEGTMMATQRRTQGSKGIVTSAWFSGNNVPTADGVVWIYAETSGGTVLDSSYFLNTDVAHDLYVTGWHNSILADGSSSFPATVEARDVNGNYVIGGTTFTADASYLTVVGGTLQYGCYSSSDQVKVTSSKLDQDKSMVGANDDGIGVIDYVTYTADGGASVIMPCTLLTGTTYSGSSNITAPSTAVPGELIRLSVKIGDRWGNPLGNHTLNMTALGGGVVTGGTQETSDYGEAYGFTWTAPATEGDYNITVTDTDPRGGGMVLTLKITVKAAT